MRKGTLATLDVPRPVPERPVPAPRILVVDDEPRIRDFVSRALTAAGYLVEVACDGASAMARAAGGGFALVVLDLVMPGLDGQAVLAELIRRQPDQAVLVLSCLEDVPTKVACLEFGAKDYLTKPFSLDELLARLRALMRRPIAGRPVVLTLGDLSLDPARHEVVRGGSVIELTPTEFALLEYFMRRPGDVLTRAALVEHVWDFAYDGDPRIVNVYIRSLRGKIDRPFQRASLETVRGLGYRIRDDALGHAAD